MKTVTIKYIGISTVINSEGVATYKTHSTSTDNLKWVHLPIENGSGHQITVSFIKLPNAMKRVDGLRYYVAQMSMLPAERRYIESRITRLAKLENVKHRKPKVEVTVEAPKKTLTDAEVASKKTEEFERIKAKVAARKQAAA